MMIFDPHLTYRGSGDAIFLILALLRKLPSRRTQADGDRIIADAAGPADAVFPAPEADQVPRPQKVLV
jgi:hypothetical protein